MTSASMLHTQEDASAPSGTYSYCSRPRAVPTRKRYRTTTPYTSEQEEHPVQYGNLMYDRRVVRGNTYGLQSLPWDAEPDPIQIQKQREAHRKMLARKRPKNDLDTEALAPDIVKCRNRINVQTELYLEELADRITEVDMECQTDDFLQRVPTPLYIPEKTGMDVATQIEEGELFDFDVEVRPVLEVLVGKTMEQALLEVTEEEELANLQAHQFAFHELRNAQIAEVQRLEEEERRHAEEKKRRMTQLCQLQDTQRYVSEKIAARAFSLQYLTDLIPSTMSSLRDKGFFYDTVERDIEKGFLPYLMHNVERHMENRLLGRQMADCLIREVIERKLDFFAVNQLHVSSRELQRLQQKSLLRDPHRLYVGGLPSRIPDQPVDS